LENIGKFLVAAGAAIALAGVLLWAGGRFFPMLGRLPGDIVISRKNLTVFFPVTTMIIISVVLTVLANLLSKWIK
jgi:hypothetical protein